MKLIIMTPSKKEIVDVEWVELNTSAGNFIIQSGHAPMILSLSEKQPLLYGLKNNKETIIMVHTGMAHITRSEVTLLLADG